MMFDPFTYWSRVIASWQMLGTTGQQMVKTAEASRDVIAARTDIMRAAAQSPMTADYPELARMVPEKVEAFTAVGNVIMRACLKAQTDWYAQFSRMPSTAMGGRVPTLFDVADMWSRVGTEALKNMESGSRLGRDALEPIHKAASSNARRLKKKEPYG